MVSADLNFNKNNEEENISPVLDYKNDPYFAYLSKLHSFDQHKPISFNIFSGENITPHIFSLHRLISLRFNNKSKEMFIPENIGPLNSISLFEKISKCADNIVWNMSSLSDFSPRKLPSFSSLFTPLTFISNINTSPLVLPFDYDILENNDKSWSTSDFSPFFNSNSCFPLSSEKLFKRLEFLRNEEKEAKQRIFILENEAYRLFDICKYTSIQDYQFSDGFLLFY
jgi:hypothetical protein